MSLSKINRKPIKLKIGSEIEDPAPSKNKTKKQRNRIIIKARRLEGDPSTIRVSWSFFVCCQCVSIFFETNSCNLTAAKTPPGPRLQIAFSPDNTPGHRRGKSSSFFLCFLPVGFASFFFVQLKGRGIWNPLERDSWQPEQLILTRTSQHEVVALKEKYRRCNNVLLRVSTSVRIWNDNNYAAVDLI